MTPTGKNIAPAIRKPHSSSLKQTYRCVNQPAKLAIISPMPKMPPKNSPTVPLQIEPATKHQSRVEATRRKWLNWLQDPLQPVMVATRHGWEANDAQLEWMARGGCFYCSTEPWREHNRSKGLPDPNSRWHWSPDHVSCRLRRIAIRSLGRLHACAGSSRCRRLPAMNAR